MWLKLPKHRVPHACLPPFICEFNINNVTWQVESSFLTTNISPSVHILKFSKWEAADCPHTDFLFLDELPSYWEAGMFPSSSSCSSSCGNGHFCPVPIPSREPVPTDGHFKGCPRTAAIKQGTSPVPQKQSSSVGFAAFGGFSVKTFGGCHFLCPWEDAVGSSSPRTFDWLTKKKPKTKQPTLQQLRLTRNDRVFPASQSNSGLIFIQFGN